MKIRTKLTLPYSIATAAILLLFSVIIYIAMEHRREREFFNELKKKAITRANLFFEGKVDATTMHSICLANYPLSAMCLHAEYEVDDNWSVKNSLYNGRAYESLNQAFTILPERDGVFFNITQISFDENSKYYGIYNLGSITHRRKPVCNEKNESQFHEKATSQKKTKIDYSFWANIEQCIYSDNRRKIGVLTQCSFAPSGTNLCSQYYGIGLLFSGWTTNSKKDLLGIFINKSNFDNEKEISLELTWRHQIINNLEIQPAFHFIENSGNIMTAGIFRLSYTLNLQ